jgi:hypothetical protein
MKQKEKNEAQSPSKRARPRPLVTLLEAIVTRKPLLPHDPAWLKSSDHKRQIGAFFVQGSFWLPIRTIRLVPREVLPVIQVATRKSIAIVSGVLMIASIAGLGQVVELFGWFDPHDEHLMLNMFVIALFPILLVCGYLTRRNLRIIKLLPKADISNRVRSDILKINVAFWLFSIITIVVTAILKFAEGASAETDSKEALETASSVHDEIVEKAPELISEVIASHFKFTSIIGVLGHEFVRLVTGSALSLGATVIILGYLSLISRIMWLCFVSLGIAYAVLICWLVRISRKLPGPQPSDLQLVSKIAAECDVQVKVHPTKRFGIRDLWALVVRRWRILTGFLVAITAILVFLLWPASVSYVDVTPENTEIRVTETVKLDAWPRYANTWRYRRYWEDIVWNSSDSQVASVDLWGKVTANAPGKATITAKIHGSKGFATISVTPFEVPPLKAYVESFKLYEGGNDGIAFEDRKYRTVFDSSSTRYIWSELELSHPSLGKTGDGFIECVIFGPKSEKFGSFRYDLTSITPTSSGSYLTQGYGRETPGAYAPGKYEVVCTYDSERITGAIFEVVPEAFRSYDGLFEITLPSELILEEWYDGQPSSYLFSKNGGLPRIVISVNRFPTREFWDPMVNKEPFINILTQASQKILSATLMVQEQKLDIIDERNFVIRIKTSDGNQTCPAEMRVRLGDNYVLNLMTVTNAESDPAYWLNEVLETLHVDATLLEQAIERSEVIDMVRETMQQILLMFSEQWPADLVNVDISTTGGSETLAIELQFQSNRIELAIVFLRECLKRAKSGSMQPRPSDMGLSIEEAGTFIQTVSRTFGVMSASILSSGRPIGALGVGITTSDGRRVATLRTAPRLFVTSIIKELEGDGTAFLQAISID